MKAPKNPGFAPSSMAAMPMPAPKPMPMPAAPMAPPPVRHGFPTPAKNNAGHPHHPHKGAKSGFPC